MRLEEMMVITTMMVIYVTYLQLQATKFLIRLEFHQRLSVQKSSALGKGANTSQYCIKNLRDLNWHYQQNICNIWRLCDIKWTSWVLPWTSCFKRIHYLVSNRERKEKNLNKAELSWLVFYPRIILETVIKISSDYWVQVEKHRQYTSSALPLYYHVRSSPNTQRKRKPCI